MDLTPGLSGPGMNQQWIYAKKLILKRENYPVSSYS